MFVDVDNVDKLQTLYSQSILNVNKEVTFLGRPQMIQRTRSFCLYLSFIFLISYFILYFSNGIILAHADCYFSGTNPSPFLVTWHFDPFIELLSVREVLCWV